MLVNLLARLLFLTLALNLAIPLDLRGADSRLRITPAAVRQRVFKVKYCSEEAVAQSCVAI